MNLLVLGGSYFLGKCFVNLAKKDYKITIFNRGTAPLYLDEVMELRGDRRNRRDLEQLKNEVFDAVVDFCGYQSGDIEAIFAILGASIKQYVFVSTVDVYGHGLNQILNEESPFETQEILGDVGAYIGGKTSLENELKNMALKYQVNYTSIRPAFIYGPDNYAPREGIYFHWIERAGQVLHPSDATGEFQMVYVEDVARAIVGALGNRAAYNQAYNLAPPSMITYDTFVEALSECSKKPFEKVELPVKQVVEQNIPLPFPLTKEESNWYDGNKALKLIGHYTNLVDGMRKCINAKDEEEGFK